MTKEKLISLNKYLTDLKNKLEGAIPEKHQSHPETYHNFLKHEIKLVSAKIEQAKLEGAGK